MGGGSSLTQAYRCGGMYFGVYVYLLLCSYLHRFRFVDFHEFISTHVRVQICTWLYVYNSIYQMPVTTYEVHLVLMGGVKS